MSYRTLIRVAGVAGGLCWLGQAAVNQYDAAEAAVNALYWGGAALILVALVGLGAGLVSGALWLRLIVGVCLPLLAWSILELMRQVLDDGVAIGVAGALMVVVCTFGLTGRADDGAERTRRGSHAK